MHLWCGRILCSQRKQSTCGEGEVQPAAAYTRGSVVAAIKRMAASDGDACPETEREGAAEHEGGSKKDGTSLPS